MLSQELDLRRVLYADETVLPLYLAVISLAVLVVQKSLSSRRDRVLLPTKTSTVGLRRGSSVYAFRVLRLLCCLGLVGVSIAISIKGLVKPDSGTHGTSRISSVKLSYCLFHAYSSLLALFAILRVSPVHSAMRWHLNILLLSAFIVDAHRNIWPLATFDLAPKDGALGTLLWARIAILAMTAVILPLVTPREFIPVDSTGSAIPNTEQTASPLSIMTFSFVEPVIFLASKFAHLPYEMLPPLADGERSAYLRETVMPKLNQTNAHVARAILRQYSGRLAFSASMLVLNVAFTYASPVAVNRLLTYIESSGEGAVVRPWVWVVSLFLSPTLVSMTMQMSNYVTSQIAVQLQAILTQLVFEHSLRIRMTDSPANSNSGEPSQPKESSITGKITTMMSIDINNITEGRNILEIVVYAPLRVIACAVFLYQVLGWSGLIGMALNILIFPVPGKLAQLTGRVTVEQMKRTTDRVQTVTETLATLRLFKLFGWEAKASEVMSQKRDEELRWMRKKSLLQLGLNMINFLLPIATMAATFALYTMVMKEPLTAAKVFSSMAVFEDFKFVLYLLFHQLPTIIQAKVSLDRVDDFLRSTNLLDHLINGEFSEEHSDFATPGHDTTEIGFRNTTFTWTAAPTKRTDAYVPGSARRDFSLHIDHLIFRRDMINLILGPTGSGKTALLLALLGELHYTPSAPDSWYNLPRKGGIAYSAQEAWIIHETIKNNILFGLPYDDVRYKKVLRQCALEQDIKLFKSGDETEVGEKGLTLSGGQKARVSLARAVYSQAEIILLDDILSALDVHTARHIVEKCLQGDLVKGRTVLLVTHNIALATPTAAFVVSLDSNGRIATQGSLTDALNRNRDLQADAAQEAKSQISQLPTEVKESAAADLAGSGILMTAEEIAEGHIGLSALMLYLRSLGGPLFWFILLTVLGITHFLFVVQVWFLGFWARQYDTHLPAEVRASLYVAGYCAISITIVAVYSAGFSSYIFAGVRASRDIHRRLTKSIMGTTLRFLDSTPSGRIVARFTQDIQAVDSSVAMTLFALIEGAIAMALKFLGIISMSPVFLIPGLLVSFVGGWLGNRYMAAQLAVKREMSNARSPVFSHFGAAIEGIISIRAYGAQDMFTKEALSRLDVYSRPAVTFYNLSRWMSVRIDALGGLLSAGLAGYLVYWRGTTTSASDVGFQLNLAVTVATMLLWWVKTFNEFEIIGNSLERIQQYLRIEQEAPSSTSGDPPAHWPTSGTLVADHVSARYTADGPTVLHDLNFHINSGETVGVVGRTGSGKSSLALSLLSMIPTEGDVVYDGFSTRALNLDAVRRHITIIPQQPELLSGTIRQNLDPFSEHDDSFLHEALRSVGLWSLQQSATQEEHIGLDSNVSSGGGNFSLGQRQIIALARALVRQSKVLILDEATASLDPETDAIVQESLATNFNETTLIIIAHRLDTIMRADKILVLEAGRMVEFDAPRELLQKPSGSFKTMVDESADRDNLYRLADADVL